MTGWILFFALYAIGVAYFVAQDAEAWRQQGIPFSWRMIGWRKLAWPIAMLSDALEKLGR